MDGGGGLVALVPLIAVLAGVALTLLSAQLLTAAARRLRRGSSGTWRSRRAPLVSDLEEARRRLRRER